MENTKPRTSGYVPNSDRVTKRCNNYDTWRIIYMPYLYELISTLRTFFMDTDTEVPTNFDELTLNFLYDISTKEIQSIDMV